uniref:Hexosyltransferase n=1 Tax=Parascaris univalens TaxID=6257 RepID=A0A915BIP1_PARUN
ALCILMRRTLITLLSALIFFTRVECDDGGWSTEEGNKIVVSGRCDLERRDARHLSQVDFEKRYAFTDPVLIFNIENEIFRQKTARDEMLQMWGDKPVTLNSANTYSYQRVSTTFSYYVSRLLKPQKLDSLGNETLYLFGDIDQELWEPLLKEYNLPKWELPRHSPALSFGIAAAGTGVPFHFHGPVFAEVIYGHKQWFLYAYEKRPEFDPDKSTLQWFLETYPKLERIQRPLECLVGPVDLFCEVKLWLAAADSALGVDPIGRRHKRFH